MKNLKPVFKIAAACILFFALYIPFSMYVSPSVMPHPTLAYGETPICQNTGQTGYTIYIRPVGASSVVYPETFIRKVWTPPTYYIHSPLPENRTELWEDSVGTDTYTLIKAACPALVPTVLNQVSQIRSAALARTIAANSAVSEVYRENYVAASAMLNGEGSTTQMRNGMTAEEYLLGFGAQIDMSAYQFAQYIITENINLAPVAYRIEQEYLRLTYNDIPNVTCVRELLLVVADYTVFCNPI